MSNERKLDGNKAIEHIQNTVAKLKKMTDEELTNYLNDFGEKDEAAVNGLIISTSLLGETELANKIRAFHQKKYVEDWANKEAQKYTTDCTFLHSLDSIDKLAVAIQDYTIEQINFIVKRARQMYPNEPQFYEQISAQFNKLMERKLIEFTKAYYTGELETFISDNNRAIISNILEKSMINNLGGIIPEAIKELRELRKAKGAK